MKMIRLHFKDSFDRDWYFDMYNSFVYVRKTTKLMFDLNNKIRIDQKSNKLKLDDLPKWLRGRKEVLDFLEKAISNRAFL